jgi:hypothetical protein
MTVDYLIESWVDPRSVLYTLLSSTMSSLDSAVLTQILNQLTSLQLSQQVLQSKVVFFVHFELRC